MGTEIINLLENRISQIQEEEQHLHRVLAALSPDGNGSGLPSPGRDEHGGPRKRRSRKVTRSGNGRAAKGERQQQLIEEIERSPQSKPAELAKAMGVSPTQVYDLVRAAKLKGSIAPRDGGGFELLRA